MKSICTWHARMPLVLLLAGILVGIPMALVSPPAEAQRLSLQQLLDRIEALEGDGTGVKITEAFSAFGDTSCTLPDGTVPDTIDIRGTNFDRAKDPSGAFPDPVVTFGDFGQLTLCPEPQNPTAADENPAPTRIRAALPANIASGDYLVTVSVGDKVGDRAAHLHTIAVPGANANLVREFSEATGSCTYRASGSGERGCTCVCDLGPNGESCSCGCTGPTFPVTGSEDTCLNTAGATCPAGQILVGCGPGTLNINGSCVGERTEVRGPPSTCQATGQSDCTCRRTRFAGVRCTCTAVRCTGETVRATGSQVVARALCLSVK